MLNEVYWHKQHNIGDILNVTEIIGHFKTHGRCVKFSPKTIEHMANVCGYGIKRFGGKKGYHKSLITAIERRFDEAVDYESSLHINHHKSSLKRPQTEPNYFMMNGERDNRDYEWESLIRRSIVESINELDLYHGSRNSFNEFDLAYLSSGWGQQAYGYGVYLIDNPQGAKEYARGNGGIVYTVKVPNGIYLSYSKISKATANKIAKDFYNYYLKYDEYGKEAYVGHEEEFWEYECSVICDAKHGGDIYGTIASILGSDEEASKFLYKEGYKGIKWIDITSDGIKNTNYVIFNPKDVKILRKDKIDESKLLQGDLFTNEFSDKYIKQWEKESKRKKALSKRREMYRQKKENENNRKKIEQYNKDSERMVNGGLFRKEDFE